MGFLPLTDADVEVGNAAPHRAPRQGFTPLEDLEGDATARGFTPIERVAAAEPGPAGQDSEAAQVRPSVLRNVLLNNPLTAIGEAGLNLGSMAVAQPLAGLAGLATEAGRLVGLTERTGADVVHAVGDALTYSPRGEMGQGAAEIAAWPFQKLAEGAQWAGGKTLEATGSPLAATAVDTAIQGFLPLMVGPAVTRARGAPAATRSAGPELADMPHADYAAYRRALESGGDAQARNPGSSATGADQFTDRTWLATVEQARPAWARGLAPEEILAECTNPARSAEMAVALDRANASQLSAAGVEVNRHTLYAAHHFGPEKAIRLERAGPDTPMARILSPSQMRANPYLAGKTKAQALAEWDARAGAAGALDAAVGERRGFVPLDDAMQGVLRDEQGIQRPAADEAPVPEIERQVLNDAGRATAPDGQRSSAAAELAEPVDKTARYALVEADDLRPSHDTNLRATADYPEPFTRPDWVRADAEQRVQGIVRDFDGERLTAALDDADGAPIVARDGVVEVGNARAIALKRVYEAEGLKAHKYREQLAEQAQAFGLDPGAVRAMRRPVLVRMPDEPASRAPRMPEAPQQVGITTDVAAAMEGLTSLKNDGVNVKEALAQAGAFGEKYSAETRELMQFMADNAHRPHRVAEFLKAYDAALGKADGAPAMVRDTLPTDGTVHSRTAAGANYTGFIDDSAPSGRSAAGGSAVPGRGSSARRSEPLRREDVIVPLAKALRTSVYEGRVRGKDVQGTFQTKTSTVRVRRHADLETTAHEVAHLIDQRVPAIRETWTKGPDAQAIRAELKGLSYDSSKVYEGFAEFVRHYLTQPDVAAAKAPVFSRWFDGFTRRHEYGSAILKAREDMVRWFDQDALDRARSKIGDHQPIAAAMDRRWDNFRQSMLDDLHGVYRMERELSGGTLAPNGAYESARLSRAAFSIADGAIRYGAPVKRADGSFGWKGKGLEEILKPVSGSLDDALLYFVGRSARELMEQGREHLFTKGEIDAMTALRRPEFDKAFTEYQAWNSGILDFAEAQGVIDPKARAAWKRTQYLPFHRIGQPVQGGRAKPGDWSGVKALTGGSENLRDVLTNMTGNAAMLIDKAVKNEARVKIANLAEQIEGGKFMTRIPPDAARARFHKDAVLDGLAKTMGADRLDAGGRAALDKLRQQLEEAPELVNLLQTNIAPAGGNVVAVMRGGKPTWYEVGDPVLLRALESIDRKPTPWIVKWLGLPKRIGQTTITMTPDFMLANIARDTIQGAVISRAGFRPVVDSLNGMRLRLTNDPVYKEFVANGGGLASMFLDEGHFRAKLSRFYRGHGIDYRTVLDAPAKLLGFVETLADAFETSTRLGEFKRAIDAGEHPRHAAYLAREVGTDFAMRGDSRALAFMQDTVMFLRPALSSWDRMYRGLAHDPNRGAIAIKAGLLATMSSALYLLNKDNPQYQDLPDWDRDAHWHFFVGDQHFRYPKIWEIGAISSAAERATEKIIAADPQGLGKDFTRIVGATFNLNLMPQVLAPLYEQATNRGGFTGAPIETPGMEGLQPFLRAKPTTSETLRAAGMATAGLPEALQVNPARGEALLRGYFNTWGMYGLMLSDRAFFGDRLPAMRADETPVIRRFVASDPPKSTRYETEFYELYGAARRLQGTLRELDKQGHQSLADQKEAERLAGEGKPLERAHKTIASVNQEMRNVRRAPDLTPDEKRERLDALMAERNATIKQTVLETRQSMKEKTP